MEESTPTADTTAAPIPESEHHHKKLMALLIILVAAVIVGAVYYFSVMNRSAPKARYTSKTQSILNTLQSNSTKNQTAPVLTAEQQKALQNLNGTSTVPIQSKLTPSQEQSILNRLQKK